MSARNEAEIIALAMRDGILREEQLRELSAALAGEATATSFDARYGVRLDALIERGLIGEAEVRALAEKLALEPRGAEGAIDVPSSPPAAAPQERYRLLELIAEGGMGRLFKAFDTLLERNVALKLVKNPAHLPQEQLLAEAQRQARIEHDNVCPIYEVGALDGQPYIAMQYIDGETLKAAALHISIEEKIRIMAVSARAVHAAHRSGLVHLDLKPSNIMVERTSEGLKPYVLDFGIARDLRREQALAGRGTPSYMAPEQRRAEGEVDRRTDVFGLGATLFEVLSGSRLVDRPQASLPPELTAIVHKCVEEEKEDRYPSAFAVAAELERYLAGEPVEAMRADRWYRAQRFARRHKFVFAAILATLLIFALSGAVRLRDRARQQETAAASQRFGQAAERIENTLRIARMMPLHDITPDLERARRRTAALREDIGNLEGPGFGPGRYALGRAYLAEGDLEAARVNLVAAWEAGYRDREVAAALGGVHARLYALELSRARSEVSRDDRERRFEAARRSFRDPAIAHLSHARASSPEPEHYSEALIAFCEERFDAAIAEAERAFSADRSLYEAKVLAARILSEEAVQHVSRGARIAALQARSSAEAAIEEAANIARSDPEVHTLACRIATDTLYAYVHHGGGDAEQAYTTAIARCDRAIAADPRNTEAYVEASRAHKLIAIERIEKRRDPLDALARSADAAAKALEQLPGDAQALNSLGNVFRVRGDYESSQALDPEASFHEAERLFIEAAARAPSLAYIPNNLGNVYAARARHHFRVRGEVAEDIAKSLAAFQRAEALNPAHASPPSNLGNVYVLRARTELARGADPSESLRLGRAALDRALKINAADSFSKVKRAAIAVLSARVSADPAVRGAQLAEARSMLASAENEGSDLIAEIGLLEAELELIEADGTREPRAKREALKRAQAAIARSRTEEPSWEADVLSAQLDAAFARVRSAR